MRPVADKADLNAQYPNCFTGIGNSKANTISRSTRLSNPLSTQRDAFRLP